MPNARKKGLKLTGAFTTDDKDARLAKIAKRLGFPDKASYLRHLFDQALEAEESTQKPTRRSAAKGS